MAARSSSATRKSGIRRRNRVRADLRVVVAYRNGDKRPARVIDLSVGGMHLEADRTPEYGEQVSVVVRFHESSEWHVLPAVVRWFTSHGFGVAFQDLDTLQARVVVAAVEHVVA